jgi:hypothetical protein
MVRLSSSAAWLSGISLPEVHSNPESAIGWQALLLTHNMVSLKLGMTATLEMKHGIQRLLNRAQVIPI